MIQLIADANRAKVLKHMRHRWGCDNLVNALKLLANQQIDGNSPIKRVVTGLHERSRTGIMDGLRNFIEVDNHSAVDVGGLRRGTKSIEVRKPQFTDRGGHQRRRRRIDFESGKRSGFAANPHRYETC